MAFGGIGSESVGVKSSALLTPYLLPYSLHPAQRSAVCLRFPSAIMLRDIPWLVQLPYPKVHGQRGLLSVHVWRGDTSKTHRPGSEADKAVSWGPEPHGTWEWLK